MNKIIALFMVLALVSPGLGMLCLALAIIIKPLVRYWHTPRDEANLFINVTGYATLWIMAICALFPFVRFIMAYWGVPSFKTPLDSLFFQWVIQTNGSFQTAFSFGARSIQPDLFLAVYKALATSAIGSLLIACTPLLFFLIRRPTIILASIEDVKKMPNPFYRCTLAFFLCGGMWLMWFWGIREKEVIRRSLGDGSILWVTWFFCQGTTVSLNAYFFATLGSIIQWKQLHSYSKEKNNG